VNLGRSVITAGLWRPVGRLRGYFFDKCLHFCGKTTYYGKSFKILQGAYKFGKMKLSEFSRPLKQSFPYNYNVKTRYNKPPEIRPFLKAISSQQHKHQ